MWKALLVVEPPSWLVLVGLCTRCSCVWHQRVVSSPSPPVLLQDDPNTGRRELEAVVAGQPRAVFIGITCGISAPYVLGQVEWAMTQPKCVAADQGPQRTHGLGYPDVRCIAYNKNPDNNNNTSGMWWHFRNVLSLCADHGCGTSLVCSVTTVLMGFNPAHLARGAAVEGWTKSCRGEGGCWTVGGQPWVTGLLCRALQAAWNR